MRAPLPSLFKEEALQLRKGERLGQKTLSLPLLNADMKSTLTESRGDAPGLTGCALVKQDVAWAWPTTTARRTQQSKRAHVGDNLFPQAGPQNDPMMGPLKRGAQWVSWADRTARERRRTNGRWEIRTSGFSLYTLNSLPSSRPHQQQGHGHPSGAAEGVYQARHPLHLTRPYV